MTSKLILCIVSTFWFAASSFAQTSLQQGDRVVFFGDSITRAGVADGGYITLAAKAFKETLPEKKIELIGAGISGHRVPDLLKRLDRDVLKKKPNVVVIYIGINDVWHWTHPNVVERGRKGTTPEDFESGLKSIIKQVNNAGAKVILCTPTVIGEKHDGSNPQDKMLDEFAAISRKVAQDTKTQLLDLRKKFIAYLKEHNPENAEKGILTRDTVHLNAQGNRVLAELMLEALGVQAFIERFDLKENGKDAKKKTSGGGLKIYYIRHAEGGHNVKKAWQAKGVPESEWPAYVGNPNIFTPKGLKEVVTGTEKLDAYNFDFVASSPLWRARNTILPYLKGKNQKAEVWPELREAFGMLTILDDGLPEVGPEILNKAKAIEISEDEQGIFSVRPGAENNYLGTPKGCSNELKTAYTKYVSLKVIEMIENRYGGSDKSVLLAGHNSSGVSLLKLLIQFEPTGEARRGLSNVGIWMVEQQADGSYKLMMYNDKPYKYQSQTKSVGK